MADENLIPEGNEQAPELSPVEQEAREQGWVPKEEFNGDEHKWVDAGEFLRRGELFKRIDMQNRELKDVKRALNELSKLQADLREVEYKNALKTLREQKKQALEEGDADAVIAAEERIDLVKEEQNKVRVAEQSAPEESGEEHPEFVEWKDRNSWYVSSAPMKAFADALGRDLRAEGLTPREVLKRVEQEVKKEFPHKFSNPRQNRPNPVESGSKGGRSNGSFQLSPEQRKVMMTFVRTGALTEKEYIESLKKLEGQ